MKAKIQVKGLSKKFGELCVLNDVSINVGAGEVVALLGSSGSGKSTFLRCLNLLETPDGGEMHINGIDIHYQKKNKISEAVVRKLRQNVGMVFQQFNLWPHLTIAENLIAAPMAVLKKNKEAALKEANVLLKKVGIADKAESYPAKISGGQQQRAAIARSLMMNPDVLLFDEPTSALDPEMTHEVLKVIKSLANEGKTLLIATHEIAFAREVATRVLFLEKGVIIEEGPARETLDNPKTDRFRAFLKLVQPGEDL